MLVSLTSNDAPHAAPLMIGGNNEQDKCNHLIITEVAKELQVGSNSAFKEHGLSEDSTLVGVINSDLGLQCILNSDSTNAHILNDNIQSDTTKNESIHSNLRKEDSVTTRSKENNGDNLTDRKQHDNSWGNVQFITV